MSAGVAKRPEWTEAARVELAEGLADRIEQAAELLAERPRIGRVGAFPGTREFPVTRALYTLIYRETPKGIEVLHVMHQRRARPLGLK